MRCQNLHLLGKGSSEAKLLHCEEDREYKQLIKLSEPRGLLFVMALDGNEEIYCLILASGRVAKTCQPQGKVAVHGLVLSSVIFWDTAGSDRLSGEHVGKYELGRRDASKQ